MTICKECGSIFESTDTSQGYVCSNCVEQEAEDFEIIKQYIKLHPQASLINVVSDTGVPLKRVQKLLTNGRLHVNS